VGERTVRQSRASDRGSPAYPYWQCFESQKIRYSCIDLGEEGPGEPMADLLSRFTVRDSHRVFFTGVEVLNSAHVSHKNPMETPQFERTIYLHLGAPPGCRREDDRRNCSRARDWTYDRLKTKKGLRLLFRSLLFAEYWKNASCRLQVDPRTRSHSGQLDPGKPLLKSESTEWRLTGSRSDARA